MKKVGILIAICLSLSIGANSVFGAPLKDEVEIDLKKKGNGEWNQPRTVNILPVSCHLDTDNSKLTVSVVAGVGTVQVSIINLSELSFINEEVIMESTITLPEQGYYYICISVPGDGQYEGHFVF